MLLISRLSFWLVGGATLVSLHTGREYEKFEVSRAKRESRRIPFAAEGGPAGESAKLQLS
jgi:hypothetical protein